MQNEAFFLQNTTGVLLMGGQSKRMGGQHKSQLYYQGQSFAHLALHTLDCLPTVISARTNTPNLPGGYPVLFDFAQLNAGPIGAIYSVLCQCETEYIFVLSCDMPRMTQQVVRAILAQASPDAFGIIPAVSDNIEPLCGLYSKKMLPCFAQAIQNKEYSMRCVFARCPMQYPDFNHYADAFFNVNHPFDYAQLTLQGATG